MFDCFVDRGLTTEGEGLVRCLEELRLDVPDREKSPDRLVELVTRRSARPGPSWRSDRGIAGAQSFAHSVGH